MNQKPDILFIVLDTQRADRLGCYGYKRALTPNLDKFAAEGALFKSGISPAQWTIPSHASFFTGLYPTVHQVTQSNQSISPTTPHLAELMDAAGYETVGFCNNPLVGVLNNGYKRGFETFYNYGGASPNAYGSDGIGRPIRRKLRQAFDKISQPIQNYVGESELILRLTLNKWLTPIWSRFANFKGQNERSVRHIRRFLEQREQDSPEQPLFMFVNLMETHLPFRPPSHYIDQVAPYLNKDAEAKAAMRAWNGDGYRWAAPLEKPLEEVESRVLNDLYDAEVAYQDDYLGPLFDLLNQRKNKANTLTIIVGDHGDGLGEHDMVGHAFNAYQELVHVPLLVHWPQAIQPNTVSETPVSTRRTYHTILEAAGLNPQPALSLLHTLDGADPEDGTAYAEVYPPMNFVSTIKHKQPHLLERFHCLSLRRAVVRKQFKLIDVEGDSAEFYNLTTDPLELQELGEGDSAEAKPLRTALTQQIQHLDAQKDGVTAGDTFDVDDEKLLQQLRSLGYIE